MGPRLHLVGYREGMDGEVRDTYVTRSLKSNWEIWLDVVVGRSTAENS